MLKIYMIYILVYIYISWSRVKNRDEAYHIMFNIIILLDYHIICQKQFDNQIIGEQKNYKMILIFYY